MKHNPRVNEQVAAMPGFAALHPAQDAADMQGLLAALRLLEDSLCEVTGFDACSLIPAAGAQGEYMGMMVIRKLHEANGDHDRTEILIPDSAHGTNPASVVIMGMTPRTIKSRADGRIDLENLREACGPKTAGIMITNPNTLGLFETDIVEIAEVVHAAGGRLYMDGANLNAIMGRARPGDMGFDVVHLNLHKTFSTPHGGGGPGAGPVCVTPELEQFLPVPRVVKDGEIYRLEEDYPLSVGKVHAFFGNFGILVRAYSYILSVGKYLKEVSQYAVLNANYIKERLKGDYHLPYDRPCMHECVFTDKLQQEHHVATLDIAKRLMDHGFHPPTIYFPLVVSGAIMIEPTESESKETLDLFIDAMKQIAQEAVDCPDCLHESPQFPKVQRLDETAAARNPCLKG
jgi:glycine dehydrogenase subunit 2